MSRFTRIGITGLAFAFIAGLFATAGSRPAEGQTFYFITFGRHYENLADKAKVAKCDICHTDPKDRKKHNNYGDALEKALGAKKVTDKDEVIKALKKIESEPSAIEGKTFGDLIEEGKLPSDTE